MSKISTKITTEEWIKELSEIESRNDPGRTTKEWAECLGKSVLSMQRLIKKGLEHKFVVRGGRSSEDILGRQRTEVVFQFVKPKRKRRI